jgi:hypothetical protein
MYMKNRGLFYFSTEEVPMKQKAKPRKKVRSQSVGNPGTRPSGRSTYEQRVAESERLKSLWKRIGDVVREMRSQKTSLQKASEKYHVAPSTLKRLASSALRKGADGKWAAKKTDSLLTPLVVLKPDGKQEILARGTRQSSLLGKWWNAVHRFLDTGDLSRLDLFRGKYIKAATGEKIPLITNPAELKQLGFAGELSFESIYGGRT